MATRKSRSSRSQTTNDFSIEDIKAALLPDIENVIKSNIESTMSTIIGERLDRIDAKINQLATLQQSVVDLRTAVQSECHSQDVGTYVSARADTCRHL